MKKVIAILLLGVMLTAAVPAFAAYDIKEMTPAVQAALEGRKTRFVELKSLKSQGLVGENNRGYVEALGGNKTVGRLVDMENKDRKLIYRAIVEQNDLGSGALATVESVFAGVQREKADAGEQIQDASGRWVTK